MAFLRNRNEPCDDEVWQRIQSDHDSRNVFLNIPYTHSYSNRMHLLVSFLYYLGIRPKLALAEVRDGPARFCKLCELMQVCDYCISDISEARRLNVPMEIGMGLMLGKRQVLLYGETKFVYNERGEKVKAIDSIASNLRYIDEVVYYSRRDSRGLLRRLLARFENTPGLHELMADQIPIDEHEREELYTAILKAKSELAIKAAKGDEDYSVLMRRLQMALEKVMPYVRASASASG